jgi:hypothetical protein
MNRAFKMMLMATVVCIPAQGATCRVSSDGIAFGNHNSLDHQGATQ